MIFLDIETQNVWTEGEFAPMKDMKISYTGVIDGDGNELDFWEKDTVRLGELLKSADTIVHYNGFTFDMPVIANYVGDWVMELPQIDLMVAVAKKIGFRPKLDDLSQATLGAGKIGSGADAVKYWITGDLDSLKKYCMEDVRLTKKLYEYGLEKGSIRYFDKNGFLQETEINWELGRRESKKSVVEEEAPLSLF